MKIAVIGAMEEEVELTTRRTKKYKNVNNRK